VWKTRIELDAIRAAKSIADDALPTIREHASKGQQGDGKRSPSLSPRYAERKSREVGSSKPDFKLSGDTLRNLKASTRKTRTGAVAIVSAGANEVDRVVALARVDRKLLAIGRSDLKRYGSRLRRARVWLQKRV